MFKFFAAASLFLFGTAFFGSASAKDDSSIGLRYYWNNYRTGEQYSTWSEDGLLRKVGSKFIISPADSYDFVPAKGYGPALDVQSMRAERKEAEDANGEGNSEELFGVFHSFEEATKFAKSALQAKMISKDQVPMPNESLIAKELTVDTIEALYMYEDMVVCHEFELQSYMCHKVDKERRVNINKVTVSATHGKPSTLYVACHDFGEQPGCHVFNVNDIIMSVPKDAETSMDDFEGEFDVKHNLRKAKIN
mmetsp:Transcript_3553/g.3921  ORF Transcript_3553/g.3921 Transcript_3553/m.3921 type:complete len:250 (+) Transcript_3553:128-877(+)|eukprot:CAMPEP_0194355634 /NCGR_PEP_ID=MMETSP0174-20130528/3514_1 /TAXON_ID=216777 /ORGANISM="Proboscia alata, Strain PI-D3" /LENGTH=249 /DNA_ID=CAMNT_0039124981 /DNA_START=86 /DNA_END=835 /DNA_ORIENTATION=-